MKDTITASDNESHARRALIASNVDTAPSPATVREGALIAIENMVRLSQIVGQTSAAYQMAITRTMLIEANRILFQYIMETAEQVCRESGKGVQVSPGLFAHNVEDFHRLVFGNT